MVSLTLPLSIALCGYVSCWCAVDINLKYLKVFFAMNSYTLIDKITNYKP